MNPLGDQIVFKQLLDRHQRVQIPMIQRDYAQGRPTEQEVRDDFLEALHDALLLPPDDESLPLNLDFIYGSVYGDGDTCFLPLDGQQRLTTLFLLHWYLAWRDGSQEEFRQILCPHGPSRFSYNVRPSSAEFFDALVKFCPDVSPENVPSLIAIITDQPWYFRHWRLDPTIQSSLTMLESIHKRFFSAKGFFSRLLDEVQPAITFQLLDLENFGLSDDLYIKMNARGKPLTRFETFKARYEQVLEDQFDGKTQTIGEQSVSVAEYFARRVDTQWADFFWLHRDKETNLYDSAVMNLFRAVAIIASDPESDNYIDNISSLRNRFLKSSYTNFHDHGWLDKRFSETLIMLLDTWSKEGAEFASQLPSTQFINEVALFNKIVRDPTALDSTDIVQFVAYVTFIREYPNNVNPEAFQEWMRIAFNLSVNTSYERPADMQRSIAAIQEIAPYCGDILNYFATSEKPIAGFNLHQVSEEKLKAELIQADNAWRPLIGRAERHGYFRGQIEFLLDFCGASEKWHSAEGVNWETKAHEAMREQFENYLTKAEMMFNDRGLTNLEEFRWERALLSFGNYTLPRGQNSSFLVNSSTDPTSWKRLLRGTGHNVQKARKLLRELWDRLTEEDSINEQLDAIITKAKGIERWRQSFANTPLAIEYCESRAFRFISDEDVYLLKKVRMSAAHAELYTFCLFHNQLYDMSNNGELEPLNLLDYESVNGTDIEPGIRLSWSVNEHEVYFELEQSRMDYVIYIECELLKQLPNVKRILCNDAGFQEKEKRLVKFISSSDVQNPLRELVKALETIPCKEPTHAGETSP